MTMMTIERFTNVLKEEYNMKLQKIAKAPQNKSEYDEDFELKMHGPKYKLYKDELKRLFKKYRMINTGFDDQNPRVQAYHRDCHLFWIMLNEMIKNPELYCWSESM